MHTQYTLSPVWYSNSAPRYIRTINHYEHKPPILYKTDCERERNQNQRKEETTMSNLVNTNPTPEKTETPAIAKKLVPHKIETGIFETVEQGADILRYATNPDDDIMLFNSVNGGAENAGNYLGEILEVSDIVITSVEVHEDREDDTSPIVSKPCSHFFTTDGKHIATLSNGINRSVKMLLSCGLTPTPERPIKLRFHETKTKKGTAHTFDLVR